jgi:prepilin-type N-terminal cleavage/methylation domain-containing protein/prepilin-type processing-associated H-X9-DG protein
MVKSRSAFSLVELLVVIGILGVLAGVLMASFSGGTESARAARCLSNMKNLANACQTYGMNTHRYPNAGTIETISMDESGGMNRAQTKYSERKAWISYDTRGKQSSSSRIGASVIGLYCDDDELASHALTNSCLWTYVAQNRQTFLCPSHVKKCGKKRTPRWSYLMNGYFGWDASQGASAYAPQGCTVWYSGLERADRRLLFSEVPFMDNSSWQPDDASASIDTDAVLQPAAVSPVTEKDLQGACSVYYPANETIGANHVSGRNLFAHVAFADGHVEKLRIPYTGSVKNPKVDDSQLELLTSLLCGGKDYSFNGREYRALVNSAAE